MTKRALKKTFDCLEFKDKAQQEIARETAGMSFEEYKAYLHKSAESGPLADFYREIVEANKPRKGSRRAR